MVSAPSLLDPPLGVLQADVADLDRDRSIRPEPIDALLLGDDGHPPGGHACHDLLAEQGASPALDHPELGVDLIGTVEVEVQAGHVVELPERDAQVASQLGRRDAGRDADDLQRLELDSLAQAPEHQRRGRAGAQPDDHPRLDQVRRGVCGPDLGRIDLSTHGEMPSLDVGDAVKATILPRCPGSISCLVRPAPQGGDANRGDQIRTGDLLLPRQAR